MTNIDLINPYVAYLNGTETVESLAHKNNLSVEEMLNQLFAGKELFKRL